MFRARANYRLVTAVAAVLVLFATAFVMAVSADDGDTYPKSPPSSTDPSFTLHDTTFDNLQPPVPLEENVPPPGGYIPSANTTCTAPGTGIVDPQWRLVGNDAPVALEGQVTSSKLAWDDNQADHHSRDRNFFVFPDLAYAHLLSFGNFQLGEQNERGRMEVEWESAALPAWALPMAGDRVHVEGSHIWDCAHGINGAYRTEIHPPRFLMTLRDAADQQWSNGTATIPPRPGWTDTMPGLGSVPIPVTRADIFGSSDGGEAREQLTCFHFSGLPPPPGCPPDWYQDLRDKQWDVFVPAPPKPDPDAQLVTKLIPRGFPTCSSDNDCGGAVDELVSHPERFTFTEIDDVFDKGVQIHIDLTGPEPASLLYGFGFTLEVGWNRPASVVPKRLKVTILGLKVRYPQDQAAFGGGFEDGEYEVSSLIGDTFRHMRFTGGPKPVSYDFHQDVPDTEDMNLGDYGIKNTGSCGLVAPGGTDNGPCRNSFQVTLLPGQPLRVFFRAEEHDGITANDESGSVERIGTDANNWAIGTHIERFQDRTSAGRDALDEECGAIQGCLTLTYKIEDDPIPAPPGTTLSVGTPNVVQGGETWVTPGTDLTLNASAPAAQAGDAIEIHARFWRETTAAPAASVCGSGTGSASCTLHLNANDGSDGKYKVEYWAVDTTAGAIEPTHTAVFQRDATPPTTNNSLTGTLVRGWYNTPVTVTLSASDGAGVGLDRTLYSVDLGLLLTYSAPFAVSGDGSHSVAYFSRDKLLNAEAVKSVPFKIDGTPPTLAVSSASDGTFSYTENELLGGVFTNASSLAVTYAASDALSGMFDVRIDGTSIAPSGMTTIPLPSGASLHSLVAEDVAGNLTTLTFPVVSVTLSGPVDPQGSGFWKNAIANGHYASVELATFLDYVDIVSRAFGAPDNRYADATLFNYESYLAVTPSSVTDLKVRKELLCAWLNLVSGREPAAQTIELKSVKDWPTVVTNTGGSSVTTALNLIRESERRLEQSPSNALLDTIHTLLEKLNSGKLNT